MHRRIRYFALIIVLLALPARGQLTGYSTEPHVIIDARVAAMADAGVSEAYNAASMYWNPGTLPFLRSGSVVVSNAIETVGSSHLSTMQACAAVQLGKEWAIGLGGFYHWPADADPSLPEMDRSFRLVGIDATVARKFGRFLGAGALIRLRRASTDSDERQAAYGTLGFFYSPLDNITYGLTYDAFGTNIRHPFDVTGDQSSLETYDYKGGLSAGLSISFPLNRKPKSVTVTLAVQKVFQTEHPAYKGALEWLPVKFIALRIGYWATKDTRAAKFGVGFQTNVVELAAGASLNKREPRHISTTLTYWFDRAP